MSNQILGLFQKLPGGDAQNEKHLVMRNLGINPTGRKIESRDGDIVGSKASIWMYGTSHIWNHYHLLFSISQVNNLPPLLFDFHKFQSVGSLCSPRDSQVFSGLLEKDDSPLQYSSHENPMNSMKLSFIGSKKKVFFLS